MKLSGEHLKSRQMLSVSTELVGQIAKHNSVRYARVEGGYDADDLTLAFATQEYDDNITLNSTWSEGDWNGDGDFNSRSTRWTL